MTIIILGSRTFLKVGLPHTTLVFPLGKGDTQWAGLSWRWKILRPKYGTHWLKHSHLGIIQDVRFWHGIWNTILCDAKWFTSSSLQCWKLVICSLFFVDTRGNQAQKLKTRYVYISLKDQERFLSEYLRWTGAPRGGAGHQWMDDTLGVLKPQMEVSATFVMFNVSNSATLMRLCEAWNCVGIISTVL